MATTSQPPSQAPASSTSAQISTPMETDEATPDPTTQDNHPEAPNNDAQAQTETQQQQPPQQSVVPGPRASRLQELYAQSLKRTLGKLKWDNFAACYPTVASRAEPVLKQVQAQMVEKLGEKCEKEFESILVTRQVVPKLNDLETLISEATHRRISAPPDAPKPTPPHLLPAKEILSAHMAPSLASHQSLLNARLQTAQSHNAILYEQIQSQRAEIEKLLDSLEATVGDVKSANEALEPVVAQLAREAREADKTVSEEE
ncbi:Nnf1 domain-containing protein [Trichoderma sp. SZMC 28015]